MEKLHAYSSIYNLGHKAIQTLFDTEVIIEEKIDGSQISFQRKNGELSIRSKSSALYVESHDKMFKEAIDSIQKLDLHEGWTYRGEYLRKRKHNALNYDRVPANHIIIFDIDTALENYMSYAEKREEAIRIGLECVPILFYGIVKNLDMFKSLLDTISILGGSKIEGVVIKNYNQFGIDKKTMMGKYVSKEFREVHDKEWKKNNPSQGDILQNLIMQYKTNARWNKGIIHLSERGILENSPSDIGLLIKEVQEDIKKECTDEIKDILFKHFMPKILRGVVAGLPEWYKNLLMEKQFDKSEGNN